MNFQAFAPPPKVTLSDSISSHIENLIVEGFLKPGDALPPERDLAQQLNVSRPSLREALLKLEAKGLLQGRRGGGMTVVDVFAPTLTDPLVHLLKTHPRTILDILELRYGIEEVAAYYAAARATDEDRARLRRCFNAMKSVRRENDPARDADADVEFHLAMVEASHNLPMIYVVRGLFNLLRSHIAEMRERICAQEGGYDVIAEQHDAIYRALMTGDAQGARAAAHLHLNYVNATIAEIEADRAARTRGRRKVSAAAVKPQVSSRRRASTQRKRTRASIKTR